MRMCVIFQPFFDFSKMDQTSTKLWEGDIVTESRALQLTPTIAASENIITV